MKEKPISVLKQSLCLLYLLLAFEIYETTTTQVFCSNRLMLSASSLLTKALIFTATSQTGSSVPQSITMFPLHALMQDERALCALALRGVTKKNCHFCQRFGELERTCAYSIRVPSFAGDKSVDMIRGCSPRRQKGARERQNGEGSERRE